MIRYWVTGFGSEYNPTDREALKLLELVADIEEAQRSEELEANCAYRATDARVHARSVSYQEMRERISRGICLTWCCLVPAGVGKEEIEKADVILHPIEADSDYNHLSVRSAVAIILDRLMGSWR